MGRRAPAFVKFPRTVAFRPAASLLAAGSVPLAVGTEDGSLYWIDLADGRAAARRIPDKPR